ncbi:Serine protease Do-like HtrA [Posidoniimonas corsicana]|uniref:Serine protease Do-like HtrA n=1 Tax=Posidoniimonas corsicana TaxID=1938618 RepID=A0A5C5VC30_9BACT|nr:S1C family serine protease [Posidoniimonas corsicana]TWT35560.1 Serine protease Do-like HtrA [Posidoniimonas corsicana]
MSRIVVLVLCAVLASLPARGEAQNLAGGGTPARNEPSLAELYAEAVDAAVAQVAPALVQARAIGDFRALGREAAGTMTGVLLDRRWVITSSFGLQRRPDVLIVTLPGGATRSASLVSIDHSRQTALLRLAEEAPHAPPPLEPRTDPQPGETAIGVGAAYEASSPNLSVGIVSAASRRLGRAVQTDAAVSPANYGGLLIDLRGRVLGLLIPTGEVDGQTGGAEWYDSGIGFAAPLEAVLARIPRMQSGEDIYRGRAGLALTAGHEFLEPPTIRTLLPGGPADAAGLQKGDVITSVGGVPVANQKQFRIAMGPRDDGDEVELVARRGDDENTLVVKLVAPSELPQPKKKPAEALLEGLKEHLPQAD